MPTQNPKDKTVVILSDDEEEDYEGQVVNENGKRPYVEEHVDFDEDQEDYDSEEDYDEEDGEECNEAYEEFASMIRKNQTLPEDHESVIFSERNQTNPLKELNDIFTEFKTECIQAGMAQDDIETSFACGWPLKDNAPDIAMNVEGVVGPITFPLGPKDAKRIIDSHPTRDQSTCFELETCRIILNLSFQEYIFDTILPDVMSYLGVDKHVARNSRLQANRFYICEEGKELKLPDQLPKGAYGTVVIILPSDFNGGDVLSSYQNHDILFQPETDTISECYYMAWYNNVASKFNPVISGHQASISFSLVYNDEDESVTAASLQEARIAMEVGLISATEIQKGHSHLEKAINYLKSEPVSTSKYPFFYMLNYSYTSPTVKIEDLKRSDKLLARSFGQVAEKAGFHMYIGSVEREVEAKVNEDEAPLAEGEVATASNTIKEKDCPMDEEGIYLTQSVIYDEFILTTLVDADGKNILPNPVAIDSKEHQAVIQGISWYSRCKPESEDYRGDVSVKYWYSNTALVFVPKANLPALIEMSKESDY